MLEEAARAPLKVTLNPEFLNAHPLTALSAQKVRNLLPYMKKLPVRRIVHFNNLTKDPVRLCLTYNASTPHGLPPATGTGLCMRVFEHTYTGILSKLLQG